MLKFKEITLLHAPQLHNGPYIVAIHPEARALPDLYAWLDSNPNIQPVELTHSFNSPWPTLKDAPNLPFMMEIEDRKRPEIHVALRMRKPRVMSLGN